MEKKIFIISGEESGDKHGAALMESLRELHPEVSFSGMGGERMRQAGLKGLDSSEISVVGIVEVFKRLPAIRRAFSKLKKLLAKEKPDVVVLIDLPDFNLRFAPSAKKLGIPVVYYISPQVWAWRGRRVKKIAGLVDKMLVVFPFELPIYEAEGVDVEFVGHPLATSVMCDKTIVEAKAELGYKRSETVIALVPGSRVEEIEKMLPVMIEACEILRGTSRWKLRFIVLAAESIDESLVEDKIKDLDIPIKAVRGSFYTALRASDAAIVTSGTATLEAALIGTPMVIVYKLSNISYAIGRFLIGVKNIGLPNIIANRNFVSELIQFKATPKKICEEILILIEDEISVKAAKDGFEEIRESIGWDAGIEGASHKAAKAVMKMLGV